MDGWSPAWCARLAQEGRRVLRYDHRDTGRSGTSPPGHPSYTGADLAADPLRLHALGVPRAHLVGLSMGGAIAQPLAARHPERVATLTLIATTPAGDRADDTPLPAPEPRLVATFDDPGPEPDWSDRAAVVDHLVEVYPAASPGRSASTNPPPGGWSSWSSTGRATSRAPRKPLAAGGRRRRRPVGDGRHRRAHPRAPRDHRPDVPVRARGGARPRDRRRDPAADAGHGTRAAPRPRWRTWRRRRSCGTPPEPSGADERVLLVAVEVGVLAGDHVAPLLGAQRLHQGRDVRRRSR